jgi:hypothetical protein
MHLQRQRIPNAERWDKRPHHSGVSQLAKNDVLRHVLTGLYRSITSNARRPTCYRFRCRALDKWQQGNARLSKAHVLGTAPSGQSGIRFPGNGAKRAARCHGSCAGSTWRCQREHSHSALCSSERGRAARPRGVNVNPTYGAVIKMPVPSIPIENPAVLKQPLSLQSANSTGPVWSWATEQSSARIVVPRAWHTAK